jgi:cyclopropane fatty-acyl-phospholipid synthase-like methyltransferase
MMHRATCVDYGGFKEMEWDGWQERAPHYHDRLGQMTKHATAHLLDAVGARPGMRLLDICCGPGHGSAEAAARGLSVIGIDFAPAMNPFCNSSPAVKHQLGSRSRQVLKVDLKHLTVPRDHRS